MLLKARKLLTEQKFQKIIPIDIFVTLSLLNALNLANLIFFDKFNTR